MADLVHGRVRKRFGKRWYMGTVREVWRGGPAEGHELLAHVAYDDGDAEDLLVEDARALLVTKPEAPPPAQEAQAQPTNAKRGRGTNLITDAFARLPDKRAAGPSGPETRAAPADPVARGGARGAKRIMREPPKPLTPEELAEAEAAKAAEAAAKAAAAAAAAEAAKAAAAAAAEAQLLAQERQLTAVQPGSVHVATLCVRFSVGRDASLWSGTVAELLSKLGPAPALHTLLRIVTVDTTRVHSAQEKAQKATKLWQRLADMPSSHPRFAQLVTELEVHLLEHSPGFKAALDAAAALQPADMAAESTAQRVHTAADFSRGDLVVIASGDVAELGVLNPGPDRRYLGTVISVDEIGGHSFVKVRGPVNEKGHPLAVYATITNTHYRPQDLVFELEQRKRVMGEVLLKWDVGNLSQYSDTTEKTGTTRKPAFAQLWRNTVVQDGREVLSEDASAHQTLALRLYEDAWFTRVGNSGLRHAMGVVVTNLRGASELAASKLQADLQIWLPPDDIASPEGCSRLTEDSRFLNKSSSILPTYGNWLMRFGGHLTEPLRALETAESQRPPCSAAELLELAENNPFQHAMAAPAALKVTLKPYQRQSLAWMLAEEASEGMLRHIWHPLSLPCATALGTVQRRLFYSPLLSAFRVEPPPRLCGGWLAEAMGLGKTIVTMALILSDHYPAAGAADAVPLSDDAKARIAAADTAYDRSVAAAKLVKTSATLVVAPLSLVAQWESEFALKCGALPSGKPLRVARWYGDSRIRDPARLAAEFDVVLTTYETMAMSHNFKEGSEHYKEYLATHTASQAAKAAQAVANGQEPPKAKTPHAAQRATLEEIAWRRIVCDESQAMKDPLSARSKACAALFSQRRWLLTGTPISTQTSDLAGQLTALKLDLLQSPKPVFVELFEKPFRDSQNSYKFLQGEYRFPRTGALRLLIPRMMMRHTKDMTVGGELVLSLPPKTESTVTLTLSPTERAAYNAVELEMRSRWRELCQLGIDGVSKHFLLAMSLLQPMQRMCSGGSISPSRDLASKTFAKDTWAKQMRAPPLLGAQGAARVENDPAGESCAACKLEPEDGVRTRCCGVWACHDCLASAAEQQAPKCPGCGGALRRADVPRSAMATGEGFWGDSMPAPAAAAPAAAAAAPAAAAGDDEITIDSKFKALLAELASVRAADATAKTLIFSQYAHSLAWLGKSLAAHGYNCATITGSMTLSQRAKALEAFQNAPPTTIFLLSLRCGAVGLNLTAASHVILLEPCLNPALEEQAIGRVYRLGQTRATRVKRLVAANTIEERIRKLVLQRVAGISAGSSLESAVLARSKPVVALEGTVPSVAGSVRSDRAVLRYDELNALFGP